MVLLTFADTCITSSRSIEDVWWIGDAAELVYPDSLDSPKFTLKNTAIRTMQTAKCS